MADQLPAVPQITDTTTPGGATLDPAQAAIAQQLTQIGNVANSKLPAQYEQGYTQAAPKLPSVPQYQARPEHQAPIGGGSAMLKAQDTRNSIASLSNMIGRAGQAIAQKKQDDLKADLTTVMQAKQNAENAMTVLKKDPNNKLAQQVLAANKKRLNDILSDPKKQKQLAKALDLSYTDPESNKTPEIATGQQAIAAVKKAGPYNASNPAEAAIAKQAQQPQQSATPRADAALAKDLPSLQENPQYAAALAQKQAAQRAMWTNVLPKVIQAQVDREKVQLQQQNANARANLAAQVAYYRTQQQHIDKMDEINTQDKARLQLENTRAAHQMADTKMRVDASMKIASMKQADPATKLHIQTESMELVDRSIATKMQNGLTLQAQYANPNTTDDQKKTLKAQIDMNNAEIAETQKYRDSLAQKWYGITGQVPKAPIQTGDQPQGAGWLSKFTGSNAANVLGGAAGATGTGVANAAVGSAGASGSTGQSRPNIEVVGRDTSSNAPDASDDTDSQDDSDLFGNDDSDTN